MRKVKQDQNVKTEEGKKQKVSEQELREHRESEAKRKQDEMVSMNPNSPGERKRPPDWIKKKWSHVPFLSDPSKYGDKETCR